MDGWDWAVERTKKRLAVHMDARTDGRQLPRCKKICIGWKYTRSFFAPDMGFAFNAHLNHISSAAQLQCFRWMDGRLIVYLSAYVTNLIESIDQLSTMEKTKNLVKDHDVKMEHGWMRGDREGCLGSTECGCIETVQGRTMFEPILLDVSSVKTGLEIYLPSIRVTPGERVDLKLSRKKVDIELLLSQAWLDRDGSRSSCLSVKVAYG